MVTTGINQSIDSGKFIGQAFTVPTPEDVAGAYITKIGIYFKAKASLSQVKVFLAEVVNDVPDQTKVIPGTLVYKKSSDITISSTAASETVFTFEKPVFLGSTKQYAVCLQTPAKDFAIWGAAKGDIDILTGKNLGSNPLLGKLYYRENNGSFSVVENENMKFNVYRAKFDNAVVGTAVLRAKENYDYILMKSFQTGKTRSLLPTGLEKIYKQSASGWDYLGDFVSMHRVNDIDTEKYLVIVDNKSTSVTVSANDVIKIIREEFSAANTQTGVNVGNTAGTFVTNFSKVETEFLDGEIESVQDYQYHSLLPRLDIDLKSGANVKFTLKGTTKAGATLTKDDVGAEVSPSFEKTFSDAARFLPSHSNKGAIDNTLELTATLSAENDFCAPIINLDNSRALLITNIINSETDISTTELTPQGNAYARYVTKTITLAEGMDAEDIKVFVSAYKPLRTNVFVYARFQNSEDNTKPLLDSDWIQLEQVTNEALYSDSRNNNDFKEYEYQLSDINKVDGVLQYEDSNGVFYNGYKRYSIKIVLVADSEYEFNPPKVTDLKVIALQR